MASLPILTVLEQSQVSPPTATVGDRSSPLTFFDILYLRRSPIHFLFFYEKPLDTNQFAETIVPSLKHSLSLTLQYYFPYAGNLIVFPTHTTNPEIRYVEGDSVEVTFAECNLDFNDLTGFHPRNCDKFYHLIPVLGPCVQFFDYVKIPVFSLQVTLFPNYGVSIGMTIHHSLVDASSQFNFLNAWTAIARCGKDESFLANGTLPIYERLVKYPELDEIFLKRSKIETLFNEKYKLPHLSGPCDKLRATFILTRTIIDQLKNRVLTQLPTLPYVSSFMVACAYIWYCLANARNDERQAFVVPLDCRTRMNPPLPASYFGNCIWVCIAVAQTTNLKGNEGFLTAAKLIGEKLHKVLTNKDGILIDTDPLEGLFVEGMETTMIAIAGTPKLKLYDMDFGWGKPKKLERISLDYGASISIDAGKESDQDIEVGVCLTASQMQAFISIFDQGLETYV